ncbi:MAG: hypothetical protein WD770_03485 [Actinomycetota bacterium]
MLQRFHRDERGVALITAMLVSMVVLSLSLVTVQLASHNSTQSAADRKRIQAIHAAEAGLDTYLARLPRTPTQSLQCAPAATAIPIEPGAEFQVTASFYPTFPGVAGQELACPLNPNAPPLGVLLTSRGTAVAQGSANAVTRTMQTEVRLNSVLGSFGYAIFSDTGLAVQNNLTVNGNAGNDGNLYTNGNFSCSNSTLDYGSVTAQGTATLSSSCHVLQDLAVGGNITMSNSARVGHDASTSSGSISMSNSSFIVNNARTASSCTGCSGRVGGTIIASSPSPAPLRFDFPTVDYDQVSWQAAGYAISNQSSCTTLRTTLATTGVTAKTVYRVAPGCALAFDTNTTVNLAADAAIITDGSFATANQTTFRSTVPGTARNLYIIVPRSSVTSCTGSQDITMANNTNFTDVRVFVYTPCTVTMNNNNLGLGGQIIGGTVNIANQFSFTFRPMLIPGAGAVTGFNPDIAYIREITNN